MKKEKLIISIVLSICIITSFLIAGLSFYYTKGPTKTISVVGLAEKDFVSDLIVWNLSFTTQNMDMKEAYAKIKAQSLIVKDYLIQKGLKENEFVFNAVSNYKSYRYEWNENAKKTFEIFDGYVLTQTVRIESHEVEKIEKVSREVSELLDSDIQLDTREPEYYYTKLADLKIKMLAEASKDARNRAETITTNSGAKLKGLKTANMGVFQITAPNSSEENYTWGGAFNTSSKMKRASINMKLTYYVN